MSIEFVLVHFTVVEELAGEVRILLSTLYEGLLNMRSLAVSSAHGISLGSWILLVIIPGITGYLMLVVVPGVTRNMLLVVIPVIVRNLMLVIIPSVARNLRLLPRSFGHGFIRGLDVPARLCVALSE